MSVSSDSSLTESPRTAPAAAEGPAPARQAVPPVRIVPTDGELLTLFTRHDDRDALDRLIDRHAAMVWRVCRQSLRRQQDAEDAFQATFLMLVKSAARVRSSDSASGWLYRVAYRNSIRARKKLAARREESLSLDPLAPSEAAFPNLLRKQTAGVLLEELGKLPERYQTTLVMRYLEGQSRRAIADQTDTTIAAVQGQLARGKQMLRRRLLRRGVSLSVAMTAVAAKPQAAEAAVPTHVVAQTTSNATALATGGSLAASAAVVTLYREGVRAMFFGSLAKPFAIATSVAAIALLSLAPGASGEKLAANAPELRANFSEVSADESDEHFVQLGVSSDLTGRDRPEPPSAPQPAIAEGVLDKGLNNGTRIELTTSPEARAEGEQGWIETQRRYYAARAEEEGTEDYSQPTFAELLKLHRYWIQKNHNAEAERDRLNQEGMRFNNDTPRDERDVLRTRMNQNIADWNLAQAKLAELDRKLKQAVVTEAATQSEPETYGEPEASAPGVKQDTTQAIERLLEKKERLLTAQKNFGMYDDENSEENLRRRKHFKQIQNALRAVEKQITLTAAPEEYLTKVVEEAKVLVGADPLLLVSPPVPPTPPEPELPLTNDLHTAEAKLKEIEAELAKLVAIAKRAAEARSIDSVPTPPGGFGRDRFGQPPAGPIVKALAEVGQNSKNQVDRLSGKAHTLLQQWLREQLQAERLADADNFPEQVRSLQEKVASLQKRLGMIHNAAAAASLSLQQPDVAKFQFGFDAAEFDMADLYEKPLQGAINARGGGRAVRGGARRPVPPSTPEPPAKPKPPEFGLPDESVYLNRLRATETYKQAPGDLPAVLEARLIERVEKNRRNAQSDKEPVRILLGRLVVDKGDDPQKVTAQMKVLDEGYFLDVVTKPTEPIGFRMHGYLPGDVVIGSGATLVNDLGEVRLNKVPKEQQRTLVGKAGFADGTDPTKAKVTLRVAQGPINNYTNGYEPRSNYADRVPVAVSATGEWEAGGLSPIKYHVYFEADDHLRQHSNIDLADSDATTAIEPVVLEAPRGVTIEYVSVPYQREGRGWSPSPSPPAELIELAKNAAKKIRLKAGARFRSDAERCKYGWDFEIEQKDGQLGFRYAYAPISMVDLGPGELADRGALPDLPRGDMSPNPPELIDGHVYLLDQQSWAHHVLFKVSTNAQPNSDTSKASRRRQSSEEPASDTATGRTPPTSVGGSPADDAADTRVASMNRLRKLGLALLNYESEHGHFPTDIKSAHLGLPLLSWRVALLPYLGERELYDRFNLDEPFNSPHNQELMWEMPDCFADPRSTHPQNAGRTNYVAAQGRNAFLASERPRRIADITDGTANTIALIEVHDNHAVNWTRPADFDVELHARTPRSAIGSLDWNGGFLALFADGSIRQIGIETTNDRLLQMLSIDDQTPNRNTPMEAEQQRYEARPATSLRAPVEDGPGIIYGQRNQQYGYSVNQLQERLNEVLDPSPGLRSDGDYGPKTTAAVRRFQADAGLPTTGFADEATRRALGFVDSKPNEANRRRQSSVESANDLESPPPTDVGGSPQPWISADTADQYGPDTPMKQGQWRVFHKPSALNPHGWAVVAELRVGEHAPILLPGDERPRPHLKREGGEDRDRRVRVVDPGHEEHGTTYPINSWAGKERVIVRGTPLRVNVLSRGPTMDKLLVLIVEEGGRTPDEIAEALPNHRVARRLLRENPQSNDRTSRRRESSVETANESASPPPTGVGGSPAHDAVGEIEKLLDNAQAELDPSTPPTKVEVKSLMSAQDAAELKRHQPEIAVEAYQQSTFTDSVGPALATVTSRVPLDEAKKREREAVAAERNAAAGRAKAHELKLKGLAAEMRSVAMDEETMVRLAKQLLLADNRLRVERRAADALQQRVQRGEGFGDLSSYTTLNDAYGHDVTKLQQRLNERLDLSPQLETQGDYGKATALAVARFQRQARLPATGYADTATREALGLTDGPVAQPISGVAEAVDTDDGLLGLVSQLHRLRHVIELQLRKEVHAAWTEGGVEESAEWSQYRLAQLQASFERINAALAGLGFEEEMKFQPYSLPTHRDHEAMTLIEQEPQRAATVRE